MTGHRRSCTSPTGELWVMLMVTRAHTKVSRFQTLITLRFARVHAEHFCKTCSFPMHSSSSWGTGNQWTRTCEPGSKHHLNWANMTDADSIASGMTKSRGFRWCINHSTVINSWEDGSRQTTRAHKNYANNRACNFDHYIIYSQDSAGRPTHLCSTALKHCNIQCHNNHVTSWSKSAAPHEGAKFFRLSERQRITRADPWGRQKHIAVSRTISPPLSTTSSSSLKNDKIWTDM